MGRIEIFEMKPGYIEETRKIRVYLPDNYDSTAISYPVVYMHDAQNLYVDEDAFGNCSWGVSKTLESMEAYGVLTDLLSSALTIAVKEDLKIIRPGRTRSTMPVSGKRPEAVTALSTHDL